MQHVGVNRKAAQYIRNRPMVQTIKERPKLTNFDPCVFLETDFVLLSAEMLPEEVDKSSLGQLTVLFLTERLDAWQVQSTRTISVCTHFPSMPETGSVEAEESGRLMESHASRASRTFWRIVPIV